MRLLLLILSVSFGSVRKNNVYSKSLPDPTYANFFDQYVTEAVNRDEVHDGRNGVRENFQNLFNSIGRNDRRKIELHREALKGEASQGQQTHVAMKREIQFARNRNFNTEMNFYRKNNPSKSIAVYKRDINPYNLARKNVVSTPAHDPYYQIPRGCDVKNGKLYVPAGQSKIEPDRCVVWHCTDSLELEDYGCSEIEKDQDRFRVFWAQCYAIGCFRSI